MTAGGFAPLPSANASARFTGTARVLGPPITHLATLTVCLLGVQIFWSVEMSYASPYLVSLGLTPSSVALVLLAGPLSGLIVQPLVGALADASTSRFGRRRPFALGGCIVTVAGMLLLGYTRGAAALFTERGGTAHGRLTVGLAVLSIFIIDFSINVVQAVDRALLVDTLPPARQAAGNAWAAAMLGVGSVVGFFVGNLPLTTLLPFLHATSELEALAPLVSLLLVVSHAWTACLVRERVLLPSPRTRSSPVERQGGIVHKVRALYANWRTIPRVIRMICFTQFFAWLAWFPVLFYTTLYITDIYVQSLPSSRRREGDQEATDAATRLGARAQLLSALLALTANVVLPWVVPSASSSDKKRGFRNSRLMGTESTGAPSLGIPGERKSWKVPLPMIWAASHALIAACMFGTFLTHSVAGATALITLTGAAWGVTQWAPFALLAEAILTSPLSPSASTVALSGPSIRLQDARTKDVEEEAQFLVADEEENGSEDGAEGSEDDEPVLVQREDAEDGEQKPRSGDTLLGNLHAQLSVVDVRTPLSVAGPSSLAIPAFVNRQDGWGADPEADGGEDEGEANGGLSAKAGVILGIHNVFIVIPQFLISALAAIVFALADGPRPAPAHPLPIPVGNTTMVAENTEVEEGTGLARNSVVIVFRIGTIWACIAFVLAWRLAREMRRAGS
ncbi:sucrose transporter [Roridomyces roridus]|uniref:Sucrose transporter n=1 Tax=Roridomyces roridus TaxID=1738132 RepID=A0AAD7BK31_9AGAR|nr:sucrose transporter [Roridomyces roridus]